MIGWLIVLAWFVSGMWFAPRAAALGYRFSGMTYEDSKRGDAKAVYILSLFIGPLLMVWYALRIFVFGQTKDSLNSRFEKALIRHDEGYRNRYLDDQERRIKRQAQEIERLTRQINK